MALLICLDPRIDLHFSVLRVEDFDGTLHRVLDFIDLPYDPACERSYENDARVMTVSRSQVRQPVNARGLGRWRRYAAQLRPLIEALEEGGVVLPSEPV